MFLDTGSTIYDLSQFAKYDVGAASKTTGIYPVRAFYPDSDNYEVLYAQTNSDHCWEFLHKLGHLLNAQEVDLRSACDCEIAEAKESV